MTLLLSSLGAVLTVLLFVYALAHYLFVVVFLSSRRSLPPLEGRPLDAVTVLIPARNEADGAVRAIRSLLAQDHEGPLRVALLVKDRDDTSVPFLIRAFPEADLSADRDVVELLDSGHRRAVVCFTGSDPKHVKVNWAVRRLDGPLVAILDCDHQALTDWVRTSLIVMRARDASLVQSRRQPLSTPGVFGLWDSLHQHVGCEVTNVAYDRLGLTVFFTGTTVLMRSQVLRDYPLADCLTEDTDLSYRMILAGERLAYNPHSGSREEVSPDLYSFLARRRRWAHGHTEAFAGRLWQILVTPMPLHTRAQLLFHGLHYTVALAVFVVHGIIGLLLLQHLPTPAAWAACLVGAALSFMVVRTQRYTGWLGWLGVVGVLFLWLTPAAIVLLNAGLALALGDPARLAVPIELQALALVGFASPLVVLLVGLAGYRQLGVGSAIAVVLTYPLAFYLDVCGVLIGMVDLVAQRRIWFAVARAPQHLPPPEVSHDLRDSWGLGAVFTSSRDALFSDRSVLMKPSRWMPWMFVLALVGLGVYLALPARIVPIAPRNCEAQEHDGHPWIVPLERLTGYCTDASQSQGHGTRTGSYFVHRKDDFSTVSGAYWDELDDTFDCNLARFQPNNVESVDGGGLRLVLKEQTIGDRAYTSGSIATKNVPEAKFLYGRFEVEMKPARASGVLTAFFLYRFDPWQEIDMEFLGKDTSVVLLNVYYNPGDEGDLYNYGFRGTPVIVDLGFDAADAFHTYAIEWDPNEIRWFVDDALIHARPSGAPTPVPHLPMRFHLNAWPICSEELAGPLDVSALPVSADVRSVTMYSWTPPLWDRLSGKAPGAWRQEAKWMQP